MGLLYLAFELLALPSILSLVLSAMGVESAAVLNFIYFLVNFLFCFRIFRDLLAESLARLWTRPKQVLLWAVIGFAVNYAISLWLNRLIFILSPEFSNANDSAVISLIDQSPVLMLLGTALLVPVAEECLFRGLIFTTLRQKSRLAAHLISAAAFCCLCEKDCCLDGSYCRQPDGVFFFHCRYHVGLYSFFHTVLIFI